MRILIVAALPLALVACAQGPRGFDGTVQKHTTAVVAIDTAGNTFRVVPAPDHTFHLDVASSQKVQLFTVLDSGIVQTMKFASKRGGLRDATLIPPADGSIDLGALSNCDCNNDGSDADETTPDNNPLADCDSDNDGTDDLDDDSDGEGDGEGDHHDGDGASGSDDGDDDGHDDGHDDGDDDGHDGGGDHDDGDDDGNDDGSDCGHDGDGTGDGTGDAGEGEGEGEGEGDAPPPQG